MRTLCKVLTYDLNNTSLSSIEDDVESYCNDSFFSEQSIVSCSTAMNNDETENFVVTVVYEHRVKWLKLLVFSIILLTIVILMTAYFSILVRV